MYVRTCCTFTFNKMDQFRFKYQLKIILCLIHKIFDVLSSNKRRKLKITSTVKYIINKVLHQIPIFVVITLYLPCVRTYTLLLLVSILTVVTRSVLT